MYPKIPKIVAVQANSDYTLLVRFDNGKLKTYNFAPLLEIDLFSELKNIALFKAAQVDTGGYGIVWPNGADISEYTLWNEGQEITD